MEEQERHTDRFLQSKKIEKHKKKEGVKILVSMESKSF